MRQVPLLNFRVAIHPVFAEELMFRVPEDSFSSEVIEDAGDAVAEIFGGHAEFCGGALDPGQTGFEPRVLDSHASPWFEADGLAGREGDFAEDLEAEELAAFFFMASIAAFLTFHEPDFGDKSAGERFVAFESVINEAGEVPDRECAADESFGHEGAQSEAAGVVFHPAGLEGGILAIVAEDEESRAF